LHVGGRQILQPAHIAKSERLEEQCRESPGAPADPLQNVATHPAYAAGHVPAAAAVDTESASSTDRSGS